MNDRIKALFALKQEFKNKLHDEIGYNCELGDYYDDLVEILYQAIDASFMEGEKFGESK